MLANLRLIKFSALVVLLMLTSLMTPASSLIYMRGDWLIYRYLIYGSILDVEVDCEFIINITIEGIEELKVVYYAGWSIVRIDKGFDICVRVPESDRYTVDISYMAPASGEFIVDPMHSGIFDVVYRGFTGKAEYYKGVLISLNASFYNLTIKIDLVNSSIPELKQFAKPNYLYIYTTSINISKTKTSPSTIVTTSTGTSIDYGHGLTLVMLYTVVSITLLTSAAILAKVLRNKTRRYRYTRTLKKKTKVYS